MGQIASIVVSCVLFCASHDNNILSPEPAPLPAEAPSHVPISVSTGSSTHSVDLDAKLGHVNNPLGPGANVFPVKMDVPSTSSALQYAHQHIHALECAMEDARAESWDAEELQRQLYVAMEEKKCAVKEKEEAQHIVETIRTLLYGACQ